MTQKYMVTQGASCIQGHSGSLSQGLSGSLSRGLRGGLRGGLSWGLSRGLSLGLRLRPQPRAQAEALAGIADIGTEYIVVQTKLSSYTSILDGLITRA